MNVGIRSAISKAGGILADIRDVARIVLPLVGIVLRAIAEREVRQAILENKVAKTPGERSDAAAKFAGLLNRSKR